MPEPTVPDPKYPPIPDPKSLMMPVRGPSEFTTEDHTKETLEMPARMRMFQELIEAVVDKVNKLKGHDEQARNTDEDDPDAEAFRESFDGSKKPIKIESLGSDELQLTDIFLPGHGYDRPPIDSEYPDVNLYDPSLATIQMKVFLMVKIIRLRMTRNLITELFMEK